MRHSREGSSRARSSVRSRLTAADLQSVDPSSAVATRALHGRRLGSDLFREAVPGAGASAIATECVRLCSNRALQSCDLTDR